MAAKRLKIGWPKVDLVVSDVNMPNMDGITMVKEKKNAQLQIYASDNVDYRGR